MRTFLLYVIIIMSACTTSTQYGSCIGAFDDKDPTLTYKVSGWNMAMGILFMEFVVPPIVVVADETLCPVWKK